MTISYTQIDTAMACSYGAFCSGLSLNTDNESAQASEGGTAGSTELTVTLDSGAASLAALWYEITPDTADTWGGGTAVVRVDVTAGSMSAEIDDIYICRVNSSCTNQETLGSSTGIAQVLTTNQVYSFNVTTSAASAQNSGDKIIVVVAFNELRDMGTLDIGITPSQDIDLPFTAAGGDLSISSSDGVTVGESATVSVSDPQIDQADGVTVGESVNLELAHNISVSDGLTVGESVNIEHAYDLSVSDGLTVGEAVEMAGELYVVEADGLTVGESVEMAGELYVDESEGLTVGESATVEVGAAGVTDLDINVSDGLTVGESVTIPAIEINATATESVTVGEAVTITPLILGDVSVSESVTVGEAVEMAGEFYISASDGVTVGDDATTDIVLEISEAEALTVGESIAISPLLLGGISVADGITVGESVTMLVQALFLVDAALTDANLYNVVLTDSALYGASLTDADLYSVALSEDSRA